MSQDRIYRANFSLQKTPNLANYEETCRNFSWTKAQSLLDGLPNRSLNLAYEAVDRHVLHGAGSKVAFRFIRSDETCSELSYQELQRLSNRFANVLRDLGVARQSRVFSLLGRTPELYFAALGTLKNGCVYAPLFSAFGSEPIATRLGPGDGTVLITTISWYLKKVAPIRPQLPRLKHVLLTGDAQQIAKIGGVHSLQNLMKKASPEFTTVATDPDEMALLHFTSGTTGKPKGAIHAHQAAVVHLISGRYVLDFHSDDIFWCTADPGWVTGTAYGIFSPLLNCVTSIIDEREFDPQQWYELLEREQVSVWYTAPTAIRLLMRAGPELAKAHSFPHLRLIGSVGEALNPEAVRWGVTTFGLPIHDNWWQTETGGIMIANFPCLDVCPGSMGKPLPGIEATILSLQTDGSYSPTPVGQEGELALKAGWPSMFRGYLHQGERYRKCFFQDWYLTGDLARLDNEGYFWFVGRADDVIKSAGHLIGPFEVESSLIEHPAVAEAAVIGIPDAAAGEIVKAFVTLHRHFTDSEALKKQIMAHARSKLGIALAPRAITILPSLPKTRSGKIMRRLLKARELGQAEGDTSTLAEGA